MCCIFNCKTFQNSMCYDIIGSMVHLALKTRRTSPCNITSYLIYYTHKGTLYAILIFKKYLQVIKIQHNSKVYNNKSYVADQYFPATHYVSVLKKKRSHKPLNISYLWSFCQNTNKRK